MPVADLDGHVVETAKDRLCWHVADGGDPATVTVVRVPRSFDWFSRASDVSFTLTATGGSVAEATRHAVLDLSRPSGEGKRVIGRALEESRGREHAVVLRHVAFVA